LLSRGKKQLETGIEYLVIEGDTCDECSSIWLEHPEVCICRLVKRFFSPNFSPHTITYTIHLMVPKYYVHSH
jgi:hypothetical protein